jgi:hypothetical protein
MKNTDFIKVAGILIFLTIYFIGFSYYGANLFEKLFQSNTKFDEGTVIGSESMDKMTKVDALRTLNEQVEAWQKKTTLTFQYVEKKAGIGTNLVEFQVEKSVKEAVTGQDNELLTTVSTDRLQAEVLEQFPALNKTQINFDMLASDIADVGDYLKSGETVIDLTLYVSEEAKQSIVAEVLQGSVNESMAAFIEQHQSLDIKQGDIVSFNEWIDGTNDDKLDEKSLNMFSSALYQLVMKTNFVLLEKNQSTDLPEYVELGYEAKVNEMKDQDFVFMNGNNVNYTIEWKVADGKLYGAIKGVPFYYTYKPVFKNKSTLKPKTILHFSPALAYGTMRVERFGESGTMINVYRSMMEGSEKLKEEKVAEDFYPPIHQIELYSSQDPPPEPEPEEDTADNTETNTNTETDPSPDESETEKDNG